MDHPALLGSCFVALGELGTEEPCDSPIKGTAPKTCDPDGLLENRFRAFGPGKQIGPKRGPKMPTGKQIGPRNENRGKIAKKKKEIRENPISEPICCPIFIRGPISGPICFHILG